MRLMHSALGRVFGVGGVFFSFFFFYVSCRKRLHLPRLCVTLAGVTMGLRY